MKRAVYFILVFASALSCSKEEISPRDYPRVVTLGVANLTAEGATFTAEISYSSVSIIDHGFQWAENAFFDPLNSLKMPLGPREGKGKFEAVGDRGMVAGKEYAVRAYAISADHVVYGNVIKFTSLGSLDPIVEDFEPKLATWGDTVKVIGKHLAGKILFGSKVAPVVSISENEMKVIVPEEYTDVEGNIFIQFAGTTRSSTQTFRLRPPVLSGFTPKNGKFKDKVTITGNYFHFSKLAVTIGDKLATIDSKSSKEIVCVVPSGLLSGDHKIKVTSGVQEVLSAESFFCEAPVILSIDPSEATYGDLITITGNYFGAGPGANIVKFGDIAAEVVEESATQLKVKVPSTISQPLTKITVLSYEQTSPSVNFQLKPPSIVSISPSVVIPGEDVMIKGMRFSPVLANNKVTIGGIDAWIYSSTTTELRVEVPLDVHSHDLSVEVKASGQAVSGGNVKSQFANIGATPTSTLPLGTFSVGSRIFAIFSGGLVYEFLPASKSWLRKNDYPGVGRYSTSALFNFTLDGKAYVGPKNSAELWRYDPATDSWLARNGRPFYQSGYTNAFSANGSAYLLEGFSINKYDPVADQWTLLDVTSPVYYIGYSFVINDQPYVFNYSYSIKAWKFDTTTESFQEVSVFDPGNVVTFGFAIDSSIFFSSYQFSLFSKFDTTTLTWKSLDHPNMEIQSFPFTNGFSFSGKGYFFGYQGSGIWSLWEFDPSI